jgi:hypothetical protein
MSYYTVSNSPTYRAFGSSSVQRSEFLAIQTGFALVEAAIAGITVGAFPAATESVAGSVKLATTTEAAQGTNTAKAVTPAGLRAGIAGGVVTQVSGVGVNYPLYFGQNNVVLYSTGMTANPATGTINALIFNSTSTRESKGDIQPCYTDACNLFNTVDVKTFHYKADETKRKRVGFIADDTHELLAGKDHDTFDINNTVGLLIKAVQELHHKFRLVSARFGDDPTN